MNEDVLRKLQSRSRSSVGRWFSSTSSHVLMLRAWGEEAAAERITSIDAIDLPNAMRIVDYVVSNGHVPTLASDYRTLAGDMPEPGHGLNAVWAAERKLELRMGDVLGIRRAGSLTPYRRNVPIELVTIPFEGRAAYRDWLERQLEYPCNEVSRSGLTDPAKLALDSLFANLMVMINQTLVHAFVHRHREEFDVADSVWEMSGAAMMHATTIVNSLAPRHVAPDPARAVMQDHVALPGVAAAPPDALGNDLLLAERCRAAARRAAVAQHERTWRTRAAGSRPTMVSLRPGGRDGRFPGSTIPASISSGFFASTCGTEAPVPLHRRRSRPEPAGTSAGGWYRQTRTGSRHSTESSGLAHRRVRATMPLNSSSRSVRPSAWTSGAGGSCRPPADLHFAKLGPSERHPPRPHRVVLVVKRLGPSHLAGGLHEIGQLTKLGFHRSGSKLFVEPLAGDCPAFPVPGGGLRGNRLAGRNHGRHCIEEATVRGPVAKARPEPERDRKDSKQEVRYPRWTGG